MRSRRCGCRSNPSRCWRPIERSGAALVNIACTGAEPPPGCRNRRAFFHRLSGGQQPRQPILDGTFSTKSLFRGMLANRRRSTLLRFMDMPPVSALLKKITRSTPGMRTMPFFRHISLCLFGALACLAPLAFAEAVSPQEQVQVQASRATSSLMLLRGEGFQKKHQDTHMPGACGRIFLGAGFLVAVEVGAAGPLAGAGLAAQAGEKVGITRAAADSYRQTLGAAWYDHVVTHPGVPRAGEIGVGLFFAIAATCGITAALGDQVAGPFGFDNTVAVVGVAACSATVFGGAVDHLANLRW